MERLLKARMDYHIGDSFNPLLTTGEHRPSAQQNHFALLLLE